MSKDAVKHEYEEAKAVYYIEGLVAVGFSGRRKKPDFRFRFQSIGGRNQYIKKWLDRKRVEVADKEARQLEQKNFKHSLTVGQILSGSWGYEQTNLEYYQVVEVLTDKTVFIRAINYSGIESGLSFSGKATPIKDGWKKGSEVLKKRVTVGNYIKIESFFSVSPWDGKPDYFSSYG